MSEVHTQEGEKMLQADGRTASHKTHGVGPAKEKESDLIGFEGNGVDGTEPGIGRWIEEKEGRRGGGKVRICFCCFFCTSLLCVGVDRMLGCCWKCSAYLLAPWEPLLECITCRL